MGKAKGKKGRRQQDSSDDDDFVDPIPVSYTHLTLPTKA